MCLSLHIHSCWQAFVVPASNLPCTLTLSRNAQTCTIDAANNFRSATSGRHGVDELYQQSASVPACLATRGLATADCAPGQQKCSSAIETHRHCMLIALVENTRRYVDNCRRHFGTLEHSTVPLEHLCQPECSRPNVHAAP